MVPFECLGTVSFAFHGEYGHILYHFRDRARYWWKIAIFSYPFIRRPGWWFPLE